MIKKVLLFSAVVLAICAVIVSFQPSDFRVTRSVPMAVAPQAVFTQVNDFRNWEAWSPWAKLDPAAITTFEGPVAGVGAVMRWSGNNQVGQGSSTIVESRPNEFIQIRLDFLKPFAATSISEFTFTPQGDQTQVTWDMSGKNNFVAKAIGLVMDCDAMVGGQFEKGLASLKAVVESPQK